MASLRLSSHSEGVLGAVVGLCLLHLVMLVALYATRIPAMIRRKIPAQAGAVARDLGALLPDVRCFADNYNHLCEAPTVFYAISGAIVLLGHADTLHVACARVYLALRIMHSIVHVSGNVVIVRFLLFVLSWMALGVMILREAISLFF